MSSSNRTTPRGGKGAKGDKTHKNDKTDTGKSSGDKQQTGGGGGDNVRSKSDDPGIKEKVRQIMEMTQRSEEEVCLALHEYDNDAERAANMLFDKEGQNEWETSVKKKKNRQASSSKAESTEVPAEDWNEQSLTEKEKPRNKTGGPPRIHGRHNDSRGWRGREKQENERNLEDGGRQDHRDRRGRSGGPIRGGGGRGRGGGRAGSRYPPRNNRNSFNSRPIETWDNSNTWDPNTSINHESNWDEGPGIDEWSTEEYTGSLADTKVFTPSVPPELPKEPEIVSRSPIPEDRTQLPPQQMPSQSPVPLVGTLNAAQTQYLNQLTQQNSDVKASHLSSHTFGNTSIQGSQVYSNSQYGSAPSNTYVSSGYTGVSANYGTVPEVQPAQQPVRTKTQRARVPPPSKIPASAVEMPGDLSIGYLDVQFGAMDLISDSASFDGVSDAKFSAATTASLDNPSAPSSNLDLSSGAQNVTLDAYSTQQKSNQQSSISSALSQSLSNSETIPQTSEHLTTGYSTAPRNSMTGNSVQSATPSAIEMSKQPESHSYSQSSNYNSYQPKSSSYQAQSYNSPSYSTTQAASSYVSNQSSNNYVNSNTGSYSTPSGSNVYQNAYSSTSSYPSNASTAGYPVTANTYPSNNQAYPQNTSQSVYGANTGLSNSSNYGNATSAAPQYNSYNTNANHKLVKDTAYDSSTTTVSSTPTSTTSVSTATSALSLTQTTATGTKAATTLAKNSSSVVSNIPPGVAPVMSTPYIMGQGIPYFQPQMYTYEDMQMIQQRIPHMTTPFYDMSYQTPTTLAAVRDGALATYSMSDGRFTRGDNNASPVPSTLSQQTSTLTQGHQAQPMLAQTAGPYFFAAPYNPMQSYQFGGVYAQLPAVTNAHGSSNNTQYPKPASYGSGYGSGYDALSQTQDYSKGGGYVSNTQNKGAGANVSSTGSTGNDLSAMYGKSHAAIGKVGTYDKQGFHSGTPPPFSAALHGSQNAGLAPSGTGYGPQVYIPTMAPHQQHHSTPLMHQPLHQMDVRHQGRRMDSGNASGQRSQASNQAKSGAKQYPNSYWNQA